MTRVELGEVVMKAVAEALDALDESSLIMILPPDPEKSHLCSVLLSVQVSSSESEEQEA